MPILNRIERGCWAVGLTETSFFRGPRSTQTRMDVQPFLNVNSLTLTTVFMLYVNGIAYCPHEPPLQHSECLGSCTLWLSIDHPIQVKRLPIQTASGLRSMSRISGAAQHPVEDQLVTKSPIVLFYEYLGKVYHIWYWRENKYIINCSFEVV